VGTVVQVIPAFLFSDFPDEKDKNIDRLRLDCQSGSKFVMPTALGRHCQCHRIFDRFVPGVVRSLVRIFETFPIVTDWHQMAHFEGKGRHEVIRLGSSAGAREKGPLLA